MRWCSLEAVKLPRTYKCEWRSVPVQLPSQLSQRYVRPEGLLPVGSGELWFAVIVTISLHCGKFGQP